MRRFKNILAYANSGRDSDSGVSRAARLAERNGGTLTIVDVVEEVPGFLGVLLPASWDLDEVLRDERKARLEMLAGRVRSTGIEVRTEVLVGKPSLEITRMVERGGIDLVVKTARPEEREGTAAVGRVAVRLMRLCPCPIWVVQEADAESNRRVLAAVDSSTDDPTEDAMNQKILEMAGSLAEDENAEFHVAHVWFPPAEAVVRERLSPNEFEIYRNAVRKRAREGLDDLLTRVSRRPPESRVHLLRGEPGKELVKFVQKHEMDLVVMGTVARRGLAGVMLGNTAERVLRGVRASLLTVKPEDFVSRIDA